MAARMDGRSWVDGVRPYLERGPLAAFALGVSSGFPYAMIAATLTTRLAQQQASQSGPGTQERSVLPDAGGEPPAAAQAGSVAPVRKEP